MDRSEDMGAFCGKAGQPNNAGFGFPSEILNHALETNKHIRGKESNQSSQASRLMLLSDGFSPQNFLLGVNNEIKGVRKRTVAPDQEIEPFRKRIFKDNYSSTYLNNNLSFVKFPQTNSQNLFHSSSQHNVTRSFPPSTIFNSLDNSKATTSESNVALNSSLSPFFLRDMMLDEESIEADVSFFPSVKTLIRNPIFVGPNTVFCCVPGRLTLLGLTTRYNVTVGEISRRLNHPEFLNTSLLGAILRKSKNKDGGTQLRESLSQVEINLPIGRRKASSVTSFTALSEEESLRLAKDFEDVCKTNFPSSIIGRSLVDNEINQHKDPKTVEMILKNSIVSIKMIKDILLRDRSPITIHNVPPILDEYLQEPLKRFSLLTHGFGTVSLITSLDILESIFSEGLRYMEQKYRYSYFRNFPIYNSQGSGMPTFSNYSGTYNYSNNYNLHKM